MEMILEWVLLDVGGIVGIVVFFGALLMTALAALFIMWATDSDRNVKIGWQMAGLTVSLGLWLLTGYALFAGLNIYWV